jgi:hypothetical protein
MQNAKYNYSSSHLEVGVPLANDIILWGKNNVPDDDLFVVPGESYFGREDEAHVTVLYGIHDKDPHKIQRLVKGFGPVNASLGKMNVFANEKYDVVVIDVESKELKDLYTLMADNIVHTNRYRRYNPHITIAFVKRGRGWKHYGNAYFSKRRFIANEMVFSTTEGERFQIQLNAESSPTLADTP